MRRGEINMGKFVIAITRTCGTTIGKMFSYALFVF